MNSWCDISPIVYTEPDGLWFNNNDISDNSNYKA